MVFLVLVPLSPALAATVVKCYRMILVSFKQCSKNNEKSGVTQFRAP